MGRVGLTGGFSGGEFPVSRDLNEPLTVSLAHVLESPQQFRSQSVDRVERTFYQLLPGAPEMRCQSLGPLNGQLPLAMAKLMNLLLRRFSEVSELRIGHAHARHTCSKAVRIRNSNHDRRVTKSGTASPQPIW